MFKFIRYISFLFKSTNQHGIHSPFVYNLVTRCLYKSVSSHHKTLLIQGVPKSQRKLLNKLVAYLKDPQMPFWIGTYHDLGSETQRQYDMIYIDKKNLATTGPGIAGFLKKNIHNHTVLLFSDIHRNRQTEAVWDAIKVHPDFHVTIDVFKMGLAFSRKEQVKEHFTIRL